MIRAADRVAVLQALQAMQADVGNVLYCQIGMQGSGEAEIGVARVFYLQCHLQGVGEYADAQLGAEDMRPYRQAGNVFPKFIDSYSCAMLCQA